MPETLEMDKRLRAAELELAEHRGDTGRILNEMSELKEMVKGLATSVNKLTPVDEVMREAKAAHKRMDEFEKDMTPVMFEHNRCQAGKAGDAAAMLELSKSVGSIESSLNILTAEMPNVAMLAKTVGGLEVTVQSITKTEAQTKGWVGGRITKLVDSALPALLIAIMVLMVNNMGRHGNEDAQKFRDMESTINSLRSEITKNTAKLAVQPAVPQQMQP